MRKIGELKGKPIIEGNPNEIKKNQIHYKESDGNITLSERKGDNTLSSVTSGSGSGEVKEYYYKIITDDAELHGALGNIVVTLGCTSVLYERYDNKLVKLNAYITDEGFLPAYILIPNAKAFAITGEEYDILQAHENYMQIHIPKGDIFKKLEDFSEEENVPAVIELLKNTIQEITKEEYEAMITYKPE